MGQHLPKSTRCFLLSWSFVFGHLHLFSPHARPWVGGALPAPWVRGRSAPTWSRCCVRCSLCCSRLQKSRPLARARQHRMERHRHPRTIKQPRSQAQPQTAVTAPRPTFCTQSRRRTCGSRWRLNLNFPKDSRPCCETRAKCTRGTSTTKARSICSTPRWLRCA